MEARQFAQLCIECAEAIAPSYGDGLVACVRTELLGGDRSGTPRHMGIGLDVADICGVAGLLVSMLGVAVDVTDFRLPRRKAAPEPESPEAQVAEVERALDRELANLGREQRAMGLRLKADICAWMRNPARL